MDSADSRSSSTASWRRSSATASALLCGGGARLPSAAAKAAGWGLSGLEFGINIPGTAGGAVRMNANAYGGQLAEVLEWVDVCTAAGTERRAPEQLGFAYRSSNLGAGRGRLPRLLPRSRPATRRRSGRRWRRCASAAARRSPRGSRPSARPSRTPRTSAPRAAAPGSCSRPPAAAACAHGGARFSEKHANFVENDGRGDDRRRAGADGRGPPPGPRALRRRARAGGPGAGRGRAGPRAGSCEAARLARSSRSSLVVAVAVYWFAASATRRSTPTAASPQPAAVIGSGDDAVAVAADGAVLAWLPPPEDGTLPRAAARSSRRRAAALAGPGARTGRGSSPPRRRPCGPTSRAATTAKAGWTSNSPRGSNCASATPPQAARKWRGGGRGARRSVDRPRSIM